MKAGLITAILIFLSVSTYGQQYGFIQYSVENGLASSQVNDIEQDHQGYLWIGTESGLSRFDGIEFTTYSVDDGLPDNKIERLYFDHDGVLWVATPKGVGKFSHQKFEATFFPPGHNPETRINHLTMFRNELYVASDSGLLVLRNKSFVHLMPSQGRNLKLRGIANHRNETLYCGSSDGMFTWDGTQYLKISEEFPDSINVSDLVINRDVLYVSTFGNGILACDLSMPGIKVMDNMKNVRSLYADSTVVLGATRRGLIEYSTDNSEFFTEQNGLVNASLKCVFRDREGNIWVGTDGNGLAKFLGKSITSYTVADGLSSNLVMSICELRDRGGTIVLGTYDNGLTLIRSDTTMAHVTDETGLKNNQVWSVVSDGLGGYYAGTTDGVNCWNPSSDAAGGLCELDEKIRAIRQINQHYVAVAGTEGVRIFSGTMVRYAQGLDVNDLDSRNNQLIIGSGNGLFLMRMFDDSGSVKKVVLPDDNVQAVCLDNSNRIWAGTMNGLFVVHGGKYFPVIPDRDEFRSRNIVGLICDRNGRIWVSTYNGVYLIELGDSTGDVINVRHYGLSEGLIHLECNQNALFEDSRGRIWVGTSGGLCVIDPSGNERLFSYRTPEVHIRSVRLFMEYFDYAEYSESKNDDEEIPGVFSLPYDKNHLTFDFLGINLKNPDGVRYRYRLLGMTDDWSPISDSRFATYSFISPGDYTFEVMAANSDLVWSEIASIRITILPPFWRTWWFATLAVLLVLAVIIFIFQFRIRSIKQKQENERLQFSNRLLFLEQRSLDASMNRHFIFNSLNSIQYFINSSDKKSANKYLSSFAKLIRKNLDSSAANNFMVTLQEEIERIELYLGLEKMRFQNKFEYSIEKNGDLDTEEIEVPSMIIQPFVENSIIHGILPLERSGKITIRIRQSGDQIVFEVEDDGVGIDHSLGLKKDQSNGDHQSKGMEITNKRLELLKKLSGETLSIEGPVQLRNDKGESIGTKVVINIVLNLNFDSKTETGRFA